MGMFSRAGKKDPSTLHQLTSMSSTLTDTSGKSREKGRRRDPQHGKPLMFVGFAEIKVVTNFR